MNQNQRSRQIAHVYLCIVPLIAFILAFAVGHVSPGIYVPIWIVHSIIMLFAVWRLGAMYMKRVDGRSFRFAAAGVLFVLPWVLATIFAGMGPPPFEISGWAELAAEQRYRFGILIVCGVSLAGAFSLLYELSKDDGEVVYSRFAITSILVAMPLFLSVMAFWGTLFPDTAILIGESDLHERPEWLRPSVHMVEFVTSVEVCLFYLATAMTSLSMKKLNWLSVRACHMYFGFSLLGIAATLLPTSVPEPLATLNYVVGIPAITMVMPYLMGLALLRRMPSEM